MKSCIFTVIKNEHEYIEDFITYHLNLGIDHIFIFEDVGSLSHADICNKYTGVTLAKVESLFVDKPFIHSQHGFIIEGVLYIQKNFDYDWCFILDTDEFVTLEKDGDINALLDEYKDYDALVLQWQNFGANGLVHKPDYTNKSVMDIFTKPARKAKTDLITMTTKSVWNLHTFQKKFYFSNHIPSDICNWCKPDYSKIKKNEVFNRIYIRHYLTKSWEEYVWKIKLRGMFSKHHRDWVDFFWLNQDMLDKKEELIKLAEKIIENGKIH